MPRPLIGITMDTGDKPKSYALYFAYATAVEMAGGLPVALGYLSDVSLVGEFVDRCDGFLFSGGDDLDPALYGESYHPKARPIDPQRQKFELALLAEVEKRRRPALGICLGSQLMNVHRGGSLVQFLPDLRRPEPIEHRKLSQADPRHPVRLEAGAGVAQLLGKSEVRANSSHKQAVQRIGRGLRVVATSPDGVIEGVEDPTFPLFLGVQWHPERLYDEPDHAALFLLLVQKAQKR
jgi:putative glutamine amidotransferase